MTSAGVRVCPPRFPCIGTTIALLVLACGSRAVAAAERPAPDAQAGAATYQQSCARCHGDAGKGDGVDAKRFYPRPRDLTLGVYKFRSTMSGTPPTDEDLFRTISQGLPGTNMPDWPHLDEAARWHLVDYLKGLSPIFERTPPSPVALPPDPGPRHADLAKGRAVYEKLGCAACHGASGRANGTSAAGLVDDWGMPIRPANLTKGWAYRGGAAPEAIVTRILAGIDGAGMPSYSEAVAPEEAWQLAHYVASLQEPARWNLQLRPLHLDTRATSLTPPISLPSSVDDPRWAQAEPADVRLRNAVSAEGAWAHPPTLQSVTIQAIENGEGISLRLTWDDPSAPAAGAADSLAVVFAPQQLQGDVVTLQLWPYAGAPRLDACFWSSDTAQAFETLAHSVEGLFAKGNHRVARPSASGYQDGRWRVVIQRPLRPEAPLDAAQLSPEVFAQLAVAVWDGGNLDARTVSPWLDVALPRQQRRER